jgi:hypothetical protein
MKHPKLHEFAKLLSGLVLGDFITYWWLSASHMLPVKIWGIMVTSGMIVPGLIFDVALFIILIHYGWHIGKTPSLNKKSYFIFVGVILGVVAFFHLLRLFTGTDIVIAGWQVPIWLSWFGTAVATYLSYMSFRLEGKK